MPRKKGSVNKRTAEVSAVLNRMEGDGRLTPEKWLLTLQEIAYDTTKDPAARIAAIRVLAAYRWGAPRAALDLKTTHELGPSAVDLLMKIHGSDQYRKNLEELETWRRSRALTTSVVDGEEVGV